MKLKWVLSSLVSFSLWALLSPILGALAASKPEMHFPGISAGIPETVIITAQLADPAIGVGNAPPPTVSFTANPPVIAPGGEATLSWTSDRGDSAFIDQGVGPVPIIGEIPVLPAENTIYTLTVAGPGGSASARVIVGVWKSQPIIATIAGNGEKGEGDDDIPAVDSELYLPWGVAVDFQGNLYISDYTNRVRRVDKEGRITTVAGTGERGYSGDGGPALEARLNYPKGLAVDEEGNLYIADHLNHRVRKVDPQGMITTVAGNGNTCQYCMSYPTSLGLDQEGNLYIGNAYNCARITRLGRDGEITNLTECGFQRGDGPAWGIYLGSLQGLAIDHAGVVYFSDGYSVRKVEGGMVTTIVSDSGGAMVLDHFGNLYAAGPYRNQVTKIDREGYATAIAGKGTQGYSGDGGPALEAELYEPRNLALDMQGNLYVADCRNHRVRVVQGAVMPRKGFILGVVTDSSTGTPLADVEVTVTGYPNSYQTRTDSQGVYVIGGLTPGSFRAGFQKTGYITQIFRGTSTGEENQRVDVQLILIPPLNNNRISTVAGNGEGSYSGDGGPALEAKLDEPSGVAADASGNIYISDTWNSRIRRVDANGMITTVAGRGESGYGGDGAPATQAYIYHPAGAAVDGLGNLYIADAQNHRIRKVDEKGIITTAAGNGIGGFSGDGGPAVQAQLRNPSGLAADSAGNLFIADTWSHRIRKVDGNGLISTVAGSGQRGFGGDGGLAVQAQLYAPMGLAMDSSGNLYISDSGNYRVRKVERTEL